jgi:hypothetical protein
VLGIKVLDHIIIGARLNGEQRTFSFADQGLIEDYAQTWRSSFTGQSRGRG